MRILFFVVNQDLADGSAHALYCLRHCWWLAATNDQLSVRLLYPRNRPAVDVLALAGLKALPNLDVHALPCIRKTRGGRGLTVNAFYYWAAFLFLQKRIHPGDILASASFPKLFRFLCRRKVLARSLRTVYEVHQLALMEHGPKSRQARTEHAALASAEVIITTTTVLHEQVRTHFPDKITAALGLGCGFNPQAVPEIETDAGRPFTLAYIGSLYEEQGAGWLIQSWPKIKELVGFPTKLLIMGGPNLEVERLRSLVNREDLAVELCGPVPPAMLPGRLQSVDALVIPALAAGRMPYVAITKAYDYLGLNRPVIAADLPSIREVLRPDREALLFTPGDIADLAENIRKIHGDAALKASLIANCRDHCRNFSWEARSRRWLEVVDS